MALSPARQIALLGSTGSIGQSTLDVIARHPERYRVHTLSAHRQVDRLLEQCRQFRPERVVLVDDQAAEAFRSALASTDLDVEVWQGADALTRAAADPAIDTVVAAIVGAAGLLSTMAAAENGKRLLLANKEALVMSGELLMHAAAGSGALVMPVDSEHNAIFQSLPRSEGGVATTGVEKILLTASGGPFRQWSAEQLAVVTPQQAIDHPNWSMGPKISVDSATLMNKGLELIEACHLFAVDADNVEIVVHPESIVHSMVRYRDGSVIAQMGRPDMRTPIAHCLAWPERIDAGVEPLDFHQVSGLHFEKPDIVRFPCLRLAADAQTEGGTAPTVLNAANEVAVDAFLAGTVSFVQLPRIVESTLAETKTTPADDLLTIIEADKDARQIAHTLIRSITA